ncbi:MAG: hypothetical protein ACLSTO_13230 [Bilophila wadsworthia]
MLPTAGAAYLLSTPIPNAGLRSIWWAPRRFSTLPEPAPAWPDPHWAEAVKATAGGTGRSSRRPCAAPPLLPPDEQAALLLDLEAGGGDLFLYENAAGERELSAWPLPPERRRDADGTPREELVVEDAIRACAAAGEAQVLRGIAALSRAEAAKPHQAEANRLRKLLLKLERKNASATWLRTGCRPPAPVAALPFFCGETRLHPLDGAGP